MDLRKIKKLMELLEESGIAEIEVKEGEESIKLSRSVTTTSMPVQQMIQQPVPTGQAPAISAPSEAPKATENPKVEKKRTQLIRQWLVPSMPHHHQKQNHS